MSNMKLTLLICAISNYSITGFNVYLENHICLLRRKIIYFFTFYMFQNGVMDRLQNTYCRRFLIILQMWRCKFFFFLNVGNPSYYCIPGIDWTEKIRQTYIFFFYLSLAFSRLKLFSYLKGLWLWRVGLPICIPFFLTLLHISWCLGGFHLHLWLSCKLNLKEKARTFTP